MGRQTQSDDATNAETFKELRTGDKVLWDGITQPVTVTTGYKDGMQHIEEKGLDNLESPTILLEGPRGGKKQLIQNRRDKNELSVEPFALGSDGDWISNLRIVDGSD